MLYNGIRLPQEWPPRTLDPQGAEPPPLPYLAAPPAVIPIDVGRQLFVDEFLIQQTTLRRTVHQPEKHAGNPVLRPQTPVELNGGDQPVACPFSDGVFYDPADGVFKMWYMAGWFDGTALAVSHDGIHWERPELDVVPGTNRVLAPRPDFRRDGTSLWLDHDATDPGQRFKLLLYARSGRYGTGGHLLASPDGVHWEERGRGAGLDTVGDNSTLFYNPFRQRWVLSARRSTPARGRLRYYREQADFWRLGQWEDVLGVPAGVPAGVPGAPGSPAAPRAHGTTGAPGGAGAQEEQGAPGGPGTAGTADGPVFWIGADRLDPTDPQTGEATQLYKVDAVAYESIMLGAIQLHYGPRNDVCARGGFPKITELQIGYSRDGFHWDRRDRSIFLGASRREGHHERGYIHSAGGVCLVVGDRLHFYYGACSGVSPRHGGAMYAGGSTNLATLRRDGFVSLDAGEDPGWLTTRPVTFSGAALFVNVDAPHGELRAEVLDAAGDVIAPFSLQHCAPVAVNATQVHVRWSGAPDLAALRGRPVRFRFRLVNGALYAFWVSPDGRGHSNGYLAAGGPGYGRPRDA